jgi:hypothetical protein
MSSAGSIAAPSPVMAGLAPAIHVWETQRVKDVDSRLKAGHDGGQVVAP